MRATLQDLARDPDLRLAGVVARLLTPAARVLRDAAGFRGIGFMSGGPPIGRPLPHIADHVVEPVAVWRERFDGRGALVAIGLQVLVREGALPGIRHLAAVRCEFAAPGKLGTVETAARRDLPFRFGRQFLAGPSGVGLGVAIRDMHDGMIMQSGDRAARAVGAPPIRAELELPPLAPIVEIDLMRWRGEHQRAGAQHVQQRTGIVLCVGLQLSEGNVAGRVDEFEKVAVRDGCLVNPEPVDRDLMRRRFLGIVPV